MSQKRGAPKRGKSEKSANSAKKVVLKLEVFHRNLMKVGKEFVIFSGFLKFFKSGSREIATARFSDAT